jgi:hypothetical protein
MFSCALTLRSLRPTHTHRRELYRLRFTRLDADMLDVGVHLESHVLRWSCTFFRLTKFKAAPTTRMETIRSRMDAEN